MAPEALSRARRGRSQASRPQPLGLTLRSACRGYITCPEEVYRSGICLETFKECLLVQTRLTYPWIRPLGALTLWPAHLLNAWVLQGFKTPALLSQRLALKI